MHFLTSLDVFTKFPCSGCNLKIVALMAKLSQWLPHAGQCCWNHFDTWPCAICAGRRCTTSFAPIPTSIV